MPHLYSSSKWACIGLRALGQPPHKWVRVDLRALGQPPRKWVGHIHQYTFLLAIQCNMQNVISLYYITGNTEYSVTYFGSVFVCEVQRQKLRRSGPQLPLTIAKCLSARQVSRWYISIKLHSFPERVLDFLTGPTGTMHHRGDLCMVQHSVATGAVWLRPIWAMRHNGDIFMAYHQPTESSIEWVLRSFSPANVSARAKLGKYWGWKNMRSWRPQLRLVMTLYLWRLLMGWRLYMGVAVGVIKLEAWLHECWVTLPVERDFGRSLSGCRITRMYCIAFCIACGIYSHQRTSFATHSTNPIITHNMIPWISPVGCYRLN